MDASLEKLLLVAGLKIEDIPNDLRRSFADSAKLASEGNFLELLKRLRSSLDEAIRILESSG